VYPKSSGHLQFGLLRRVLSSSDSMAPGQVSAVVALLKIVLDPVARGLASAHFEDEPISKE
jgi:hypothetical protein